ncbi:maleylpyruvate isomerase family mycothiol-dependent enzyme [Tsukamurella conjunctivitidis]|uniref:Maleylpyruvate isomerase family mycothiol-dependent enzyme n=1 Tax=Tsukamurella conjunctivitidis TaxID=2592068 RepID=A0A5C5S305_9ACTN|nr:maleylpyruvate isomerase family mycothiol-dependent enzyme [Tsukamurella conjunctivitidis]TWS29312.1 maleylpyruvate isomerase family mycothiol-dependent enzyme [Tsukamurella conjunctivitidis]
MDARLWSLIFAERAALADDLADLTEEQWRTPSLCAGLTVREVLAHLTAGASDNPVVWFAGVLRNRFDFDANVAQRLAKRLGGDSADTLRRFRAIETSRTKAPIPVVAMLGEAVVHAEDIRRPSGLQREYPMEALTRLAQLYSGSDLMVPSASRARGVRLRATDGDFTAGSGPEVAGTTLALVMALTGRDAYLPELSGDGLAEFAAR